jgi:hypothetical protein
MAPGKGAADGAADRLFMVNSWLFTLYVKLLRQF